MIEALQFDFMRNALAAGLLVSIACGVIGTLVVVNRMVFLAGGVAHAAYGGIGLAFFLRLPPTLGALLFAGASALVMGSLSLRYRERADVFIGVLWAVGMALGVVLIDLTPGYHVDLMSYLFGSILAVPARDVWIMAGCDAVILLAVVVFLKEFEAISYDEEFAEAAGVPVRALYLVLMALVALSVVMLIRVVGLILVIALLSIPAFIAERHTRTLGRMMVLASVLGALFTVAGLALSFHFDLTSGAAIILVAGTAFACERLAAQMPVRGRRLGAG